MKKIVSLIISVAMLSAFVAGCSDAKTNETTETTAAETEATTVADETEATEETEAAVDTVVITDSVGHEVEVPANPEKVVSVSPTLTEIVCALGADDKLVGRTDYDDYPMSILSLPSVGAIDAPDLEAIAALEPDLVIASSIFTDESYDAVTALGIPVVIIVDEESFEGTFDIITLTGAVLGCPDSAEALNAALKDRFEQIAVEEVAEDAPSIYYCLGFGEYGEFAATGDTFVNDMIEAAGAKNAAKDGEFWSFSVEALVEADPDIIILSTWVDYQTFTTTAPYSDLKAVKNGQVFQVDGNLFERQGPRNIEGMELLAGYIAALNGEADEAEAA